MELLACASRGIAVIRKMRRAFFIFPHNAPHAQLSEIVQTGFQNGIEIVRIIRSLAGSMCGALGTLCPNGGAMGQHVTKMNDWRRVKSRLPGANCNPKLLIRRGNTMVTHGSLFAPPGLRRSLKI